MRPGWLAVNSTTGAAVVGDDDRVLDDAGGGFAVDVDQLPQMAVHVQRVGVVGAVAEGEAVALAFVQHELILVRVGLAVDGEGVELACAAGDLLEDHVDVLDAGV